ncbi:MAG: MFS transporter [Chloroflexota bacterium]
MKRPFHVSPYFQIVLPLAIGETLVWGATFYLFPGLLLTWEQDLGWSKGVLSGAFTAALLVSAIMAPIMGRQIDRGIGKWVFVIGCVISGIALIFMSQVTAVWHFYAAWIALGVGMAGTLYEPCFALITHFLLDRRKQAITIVTLFAGFASTISFPTSFNLINRLGWRPTVQIFAGVVLFVVLPLLWLGAVNAERFGDSSTKKETTQQSSSINVLRNPMFWLLAVGYIAMALNHSVLLTHLLPLLNERGISEETAVFAASMIGPMQVAGRIGMILAEKRLTAMLMLGGCFVAMMFSAVSFYSILLLPLLLIPAIILQGGANGIISILRPVVTADLLGEENFGVISGMLALPFLAGSAFAPTLAAIIWQEGGYDIVIIFAGGIAFVGLMSLVAAGRLK